MSRVSAVSSRARWALPIAVLVPWLAVLGLQQVPLFPLVGPLPPQPPLVVAAAAVAVVVVVRLLRPSLVPHVLALAITTCAIALWAAQIGSPLANATADYCGDFCRTAIIGRFVTFFGWPVATGIVLLVLARRSGDTDLASWTRAWAWVTLVAGLLASSWWWRTILPEG